MTDNKTLEQLCVASFAMVSLCETNPEFFSDEDKIFAGLVSLQMVQQLAAAGLLVKSDGADPDKIVTERVISYLREQFPESSAQSPRK